MVKDDRFDYFGRTGLSAAELRAQGYVVWLPPRRKGEFLGEGDTFTYLNLLDNGLGAYREETRGGWAGRVVVNPALQDTLMRSGQGDAAASFETFMRSLEAIGPDGPSTRPASPQPNFTPAAQNDFAARMQWSVTPVYAGANHEPIVSIKGPARISARPGERIQLEAVVTDPDANAVTVRWWRWKDVDTYPGDVSPVTVTALATEVRIPNDATSGQTIQLVLEATDSGTPALTRYQRVVVVVTP
jgi:hypothetical protein